MPLCCRRGVICSKLFAIIQYLFGSLADLINITPFHVWVSKAEFDDRLQQQVRERCLECKARLICDKQHGCKSWQLEATRLTKMISQLAASNEASASSLRRVPVGPLQQQMQLISYGLCQNWCTPCWLSGARSRTTSHRLPCFVACCLPCFAFQSCEWMKPPTFDGRDIVP